MDRTDGGNEGDNFDVMGETEVFFGDSTGGDTAYNRRWLVWAIEM